MAPSEFELSFIIIALFIFLVKIIHIIGRRFEFPDVLGELILGFILGPTVLGIFYLRDQPTTSLNSLFGFTDEQLETTGLIIRFISEFAVLLLLFKVGTEVNLSELKALGKKAIGIATGGIVVPLIVGVIFSLLLASVVGIPITPNGISNMEIAILVGMILSATSIGIALRIFMDLEIIRTKISQTVVGAAVLDDIIVVTAIGLMFTYITSNTSLNLAGVIQILIEISIFFVISIILFKFVIPWFKRFTGKFDDKSIPLFVSIGFMLAMAVLAQILQLTPIIGAFVAGVIIGNEDDYLDIHQDFEPITTWIIPFFFLSIGLQVNAQELATPILIVIAVALTIISMAAKMLGGAAGAKVFGFTWDQSKIIGLAMASRGEVTLIFATQAFVLGFFSFELYGIIILSVVMTIILSVPILKHRITNSKDIIT